jgi:hypothetical protein
VLGSLGLGLVSLGNFLGLGLGPGLGLGFCKKFGFGFGFLRKVWVWVWVFVRNQVKMEHFRHFQRSIFDTELCCKQ